jgi:hypothetical protein
MIGMDHIIKKIKNKPLYSKEDISSLLVYVEKLVEQNDYLAKEIKKLLDDKETLLKRLNFYKNITITKL